jgi:hypothetical protein
MEQGEAQAGARELNAPTPEQEAILAMFGVWLLQALFSVYQELRDWWKSRDERRTRDDGLSGRDSTVP